MRRGRAAAAADAAAVAVVVATAVAGLIWHGAGMLAAAIGGALAYYNFKIIARIGRSATNQVARDTSRDNTSGAAGRLMWRMALKMVTLLALVWLLLTFLELAVAPFALGISTFVVSIFLSAAGLIPQPKTQARSEAS